MNRYFSILFAGATLSIFSVSYGSVKPTLFTAKVINNTGTSVFLTQGSLPNPKHLHPSNPMFCPVFSGAMQQEEQPLHWNLDGSLFPAHVQSVDVETHFYVGSGPTTPLSQQSDLCVSLSKAQQHQTKNEITCATQPYVKYGGIKFSAYNGGIVTITNLKKIASGYTADCTLNTYTYLNTTPPYLVLNVGQNYVPPAQPLPNTSTKTLPTRTTPILALNHYINNFKGTQPLPLVYQFSGNANVLGKTDEALLQEKNNRLFVQHNVSYAFFDRYYNSAATKLSSGCLMGGVPVRLC